MVGCGPQAIDPTRVLGSRPCCVHRGSALLVQRIPIRLLCSWALRLDVTTTLRANGAQTRGCAEVAATKGV